MLVQVNIGATAVAVAHQHIAEALQFVLIERLHLLGRIVGLVLGGDHLQSKSHSAHVDIGGVAVALFIGTQVRARINRNAVVRRLVTGIDLQVGEGSLDVDFLVLLVLVVHMNRAGGQQQRHTGDYESQ